MEQEPKMQLISSVPDRSLFKAAVFAGRLLFATALAGGPLACAPRPSLSQSFRPAATPDSRRSDSTPQLVPTLAPTPSMSPTIGSNPASERVVLTTSQDWQRAVHYQAPPATEDLGRRTTFVNADCENDPATASELLRCLRGSLARNFLLAEGVNVNALTEADVLPKRSYADYKGWAREISRIGRVEITPREVAAILGQVGETRTMTFRKVLKDGRIVLASAAVTLVDGPTNRLDELNINQLVWGLKWQADTGTRIGFIQDVCENPMGTVITLRPKAPTSTSTSTSTTTSTATATRTATATATSTQVPTAQPPAPPEEKEEASPTPVPPPTPTRIPPTATKEVTATPQPTPEATATATEEPTATPQPVPEATEEPTATPQPVPDVPDKILPTATREPLATAQPNPLKPATATSVPPANSPLPAAGSTSVPAGKEKVATPGSVATAPAVVATASTETNSPKVAATADKAPVPTAPAAPVATAANTPAPTAGSGVKEGMATPSGR